MNLLFIIFAAIVVVSALGVVLLRNPVHSALALVSNLVGVAAIYAMLNAHFLAVVQIIVYAGAIVVLVLFVLMLLNMKVEALKRHEKIFYTTVMLVAVAFCAAILPILHQFFGEFNPAASLTIASGAAASGAAALPRVEGTVEAIGKVLFTRYLFLFEAASILIMAALVGAVMLSHRVSNANGSSVNSGPSTDPSTTVRS